jgi:hypothetical protein
MHKTFYLYDTYTLAPELVTGLFYNGEKSFHGLWSFQAGGTKLERFLHRNQHTQRKSLNFEFWINGQLHGRRKVHD